MRHATTFIRGMLIAFLLVITGYNVTNWRFYMLSLIAFVILETTQQSY